MEHSEGSPEPRSSDAELRLAKEAGSAVAGPPNFRGGEYHIVPEGQFLPRSLEGPPMHVLS
jgi:hypothetical protein